MNTTIYTKKADVMQKQQARARMIDAMVEATINNDEARAMKWAELIVEHDEAVLLITHKAECDFPEFKCHECGGDDDRARPLTKYTRNGLPIYLHDDGDQLTIENGRAVRLPPRRYPKTINEGGQPLTIWIAVKTDEMELCPNEGDILGWPA